MILAGAGFHLGRCFFVLGATSITASLVSLAKPGLGTRVSCDVVWIHCFETGPRCMLAILFGFTGCARINNSFTFRSCALYK